ncbi:MAG: hypothetical protein ACRDA5_10780 [Clostridium sp.]
MNILGINNNANMYMESKSNGVVDLLKPKEQVKRDGSMGSLILEMQKEKEKAEEIAKKIARGKAVNSEDMKYLRAKNPSLLDKAVNVNNERKILEMKISGAKSKEEAQRIVRSAKSLAIDISLIPGTDSITESKLNLESIKEAMNNTNIESRKYKEKKQGIDEFA